MTASNIEEQVSIPENNFFRAFKELYPTVLHDILQFKESLTKSTEQFTKPIIILSLASVDAIIASYVLINTLTALQCPFDLHFFSSRVNVEEITQYLKKIEAGGQVESPIILVGWPPHLSLWRQPLVPWVKALNDNLHVISIEAPPELPIPTIGINLRLPWTITVLTAIFSAVLLGRFTWWHFLAVCLESYHEQLDVGMSSNYPGITDLFMKEASDLGALTIKPDINITNTSNASLIDVLSTIFSPALSSEEVVEKFLLKHDIEPRDKKSTALRTILDLSTAEKTRLISGLIKDFGLTPESLIRKTIFLKTDDQIMLNVKQLNQLLLEMLTNPHNSPTTITKMLLLLPREEELDYFKRKNGFDLETSLYEIVKSLKEATRRDIADLSMSWFKISQEVSLPLKIEAAGLACRQLRQHILFSSPLRGDSPTTTWHHLLFQYWEEGTVLRTSTIEKNLEKVERLFSGFKLLPRTHHRCVAFQTAYDITLEQLMTILQFEEDEEDDTINAN